MPLVGRVAEAGIRGVSDGQTEHWLVEIANVGEVVRLMEGVDVGDGMKWTDPVAGESLIGVQAQSLPGLVAGQTGQVSLLSLAAASRPAAR